MISLQKKISFIKLITFFLLFFSFNSIDLLISFANENSVNELIRLLFYLLAIIVLNIFILYLFYKKNFFFLIFGFTLFINFLSINYSFSSEFLNLNLYKKIYVILFLLSIFWLITLILIKKDLLNKISIIYLFLIFLKISIPFFSFQKSPAEVSYDKFNKLFNTKPNFIIFTIDRLSSNEHLNNYFDNENFDYRIEELEKNYNKMHKIYSDGFDTKTSLNSIFLINEKNLINKYISERKSESPYYKGKENSPLSKLLKFNDYKIISSYPFRNYLGKRGKYIDEFFYNETNKFCDFKKPWFYFQLYNYCYLNNLVKNQVKKKLDVEAKQSEWLKKLLIIVEKYSLNEENTFSIHHIKLLGVEGLNEKHRVRRYYSQLNSFFKILNQKIERADKKIFIFVVGDHGPYFFRNLKKVDNEKLYLDDRYGTIGYYSKNFKTKKKCEINSKTIKNISQMMENIFKCVF